MKHQITTYRGSSIYYHEDMDSFSYDNIESDVRQTILDVKNAIDNSIQINLQFKPFMAFRKYFTDKDVYSEINISKILPNGTLLYIDGTDKIHTLNIRDRKLLFKPDMKVTNAILEADNILKIAKNYRDKTVHDIVATLIPMDLSHL